MRSVVQSGAQFVSPRSQRLVYQPRDNYSCRYSWRRTRGEGGCATTQGAPTRSSSHRTGSRRTALGSFFVLLINNSCSILRLPEILAPTRIVDSILSWMPLRSSPHCRAVFERSPPARLDLVVAVMCRRPYRDILVHDTYLTESDDIFPPGERARIVAAPGSAQTLLQKGCVHSGHGQKGH